MSTKPEASAGLRAASRPRESGSRSEAFGAGPPHGWRTDCVARCLREEIAGRCTGVFQLLQAKEQGLILFGHKLSKADLAERAC